MGDIKTVDVSSAGTKAAQAVIRTSGYENVNTISVGDLVRVAEAGKCYDGIVLGIFKDGFELGWFDSHNRRQYDGFTWNAEIMVF